MPPSPLFVLPFACHRRRLELQKGSNENTRQRFRYRDITLVYLPACPRPRTSIHLQKLNARVAQSRYCRDGNHLFPVQETDGLHIGT